MAIARGSQEVVWNGAGWGSNQGDLATPSGWTLVGFEDFLTDAAVSTVRAAYPSITYYNGYYDTSKNGYYNPDKTLSVANSALSVQGHSESIYTTAAATSSGDTITTPTVHGLIAGDHIVFTNVGATGLTAGTRYRVVASPGSTTFKVAASYASAITSPAPITLGTASSLAFSARRINVGTLLPFTGWSGQIGGRYAIRMRTRYTTGSAGFKTAPLGWPANDNWNEGEWDWPEAAVGGSAQAFAHVLGNPNTSTVGVAAPKNMTDWHIYTVEWNPTATTPYLRYYFDGALLASAPASSIPATSMRWVLQLIETSLDAANPPDASTVGLVEVDWAAQWKLTS